MRSTWTILAVLALGCGDGTHSGTNGDDGTSGGGNGASSGGNGGTGGSGAADTTRGNASGGTGGDTTSSGGGRTTGSISLTRTSSATTSSTTSNGGSGGGILGGGGQGGDSSQIFGVGGPCNDSSDCQVGLDCITADSDSYQVDQAGTLAGPPGGICSASCETHDDCYALDPNSLCLGISETQSYCMQLCLPGNGTVDCNRRADMMCGLLPSGNDGGTCNGTADCAAGQVCSGGNCVGAVPVCSPNCATDDYCPQGRFCDPFSGLCVDEEPAGADVGEACEQSSDCKSLSCVEGLCSRYCTVAVDEACGDLTSPLSAICWPLLDVTTDPGDMGRCLSLCDCDSDCANGTCLSFQNAQFEADLGRSGFCGELLQGDIELTCQ